MSVGLTIQIDGHKAVAASLLKTADAVKDWKKPLFDIRGDVASDISSNFASRGQLFGGWPPRKQGYAWPPLQKTGRLRGGFDGNARISATELTMWNSVSYGIYHQYGTKYMPKRVILKITSQRATAIFERLNKHIEEATK